MAGRLTGLSEVQGAGVAVGSCWNGPLKVCEKVVPGIDTELLAVKLVETTGCVVVVVGGIVVVVVVVVGGIVVVVVVVGSWMSGLVVDVVLGRSVDTTGGMVTGGMVVGMVVGIVCDVAVNVESMAAKPVFPPMVS
jgi:hypothetical protein